MKGLNFLMKNTKQASVLLLCLAAATLSSLAVADTQLNIRGTIKASPCDINVPTGGVDVDLGQDIMAATLLDAGSSTPWVPVSIEVNNCPVTTKATTMTLNGMADSTENTMYANNGTAKEVQIQLQSSSGTALGNASTMVQNIDTASRGTVFNMQARAYSSKGNATPGSIEGVVQLTFIYQ